jgi:hypothetical protein
MQRANFTCFGVIAAKRATLTIACIDPFDDWQDARLSIHRQPSRERSVCRASKSCRSSSRLVIRTRSFIENFRVVKIGIGAGSDTVAMIPSQYWYRYRQYFVVRISGAVSAILSGPFLPILDIDTFYLEKIVIYLFSLHLFLVINYYEA